MAQSVTNGNNMGKSVILDHNCPPSPSAPPKRPGVNKKATRASRGSNRPTPLPPPLPAFVPPSLLPYISLPPSPQAPDASPIHPPPGFHLAPSPSNEALLSAEKGLASTHHLVAPLASAAKSHRLRGHDVADAVPVALAGDEFEENVPVRETPAHVRPVLALLAHHENGQPVPVREALDHVVHRVRQQAARSVAAAASSLRTKKKRERGFGFVCVC